MRRLVILVACLCCLMVGVTAQEQAAPQVPQEAKQKLASLQQQAASLAYAMSVLQKEQDATLAELNRAVQALQLAGWTLDGSQGIANLKYVKVEPTAEPPKGAPPQ
jgi:hypothetical protein